MGDVDKVKTWAAAKKLDEETVTEILRNGFNSMEALSLLTAEDASKFGIPIGQKKLLIRAVKKTFIQDTDTNSVDNAEASGSTSGQRGTGSSQSELDSVSDPFVREVLRDMRTQQKDHGQVPVRECSTAGIATQPGTIDKAYPRTNLGYAFEITEPAAQRIISRAKVMYEAEYITACQKDSQDMTENDRKHLLEICQQSTHYKILITHGTDTMMKTAEYIAQHNLPKVIVITGAFLPEAFKESDGDFNVGFACGALQTQIKHGVYIAMNGQIQEWDKMTRDNHTFMFTNKV